MTAQRPMLDEILKLRGKSIILSEFDEQSLKELVSVLKEVSIAPGTDLVREGERADSAYFVFEGRLQVLTMMEGNDVVINEMGPGDILGEVSLFSGGDRTATVRAVTKCRLGYLPLKDFGRLLDRRPELARKMMESATRRMRRSQLAERVEQIFGPLDREIVRDLEKEMEWISLRGGETLFHQGREAKSVYIVIEGRLRVIAEDESHRGKVLDEVGPGETVGEIALITDGTRAATVCAVRDSEVARFTRDSFERLADKYPRVMMHVGRLLGNRLVKMLQGPERHDAVPTTITVIPVGDNVLFRDFIHRLSESVSKHGPTLNLSSSRVDLALESSGISIVTGDQPAVLRLEHWLSEQEAAHEFVIYEADMEWTGWTDRCLRQGDHILFVARSDMTAEMSALERQCLEQLPPHVRPRTSLILLHPEGVDEPKGTREWLVARDVDHHYHVRLDYAEDNDRLARILTGNATGLVLGGGGARGFAHIGILRAIEELGIPIDFVGGTSQGSIMGGGLAMGLESAEIHRRSRNLFEKMFDFTFPMVALIAGRRIHGKLLSAFGERDIEDLPITFFCVSTNLTQAKEVVHRTGPLHRAVRSSISLPGFMPPVCLNGDLLIDGGLLNNVPVDVMRSICGRGIVIAVDVAPSVGTNRDHDFPAEVSGWETLFRKLNPFGKKVLPPLITSTMAMSAFVGGINSRIRRKEAGLADLYLELPVGKWAILDFNAMEDIVRVGYEYGLEALRAAGYGPPENSPCKTEFGRSN